MIGCDGSRYRPALDRAGRRVEHDAKTTEGPAVVGDGDEEARGQPVQRAHLAPDQRHLAAEPHRPNLECVHRRHDRGFELGQPRIRIHIVERSKQLFLRVRVAGRAVAADADADRAGTAALPLRLPDGVEDALPDAVERAIGSPEMWKLDRHRVLGVGVLAAAALEDQLDLDVGLFPLIEMNDWRARPEVVARVLAGDGVDGVRPELAAARGFGDRLTDLLPHPDLVRAERDLHLEGGHPGVLADGAFAVGGEIDVLRDDGQRLRCARLGRLRDQRSLHRGAHVGRQVR